MISVNGTKNISPGFRKWFADYNLSKGGALLLLLIAILLPFYILSFYNHPCWDDYFDSDLAIQRGILGAQKWWYFNWGGRYFSTLALCVNPMVFHADWAYKWNTVILLSLLLIATYWLSGKLFKTLSTSGRIATTALFIIAFIRHLPEISSEFFWQCSSYNCLTAEIMTLFLLGCMLSYSISLHKKWYLILSCILAIAIVGSYEISLIFLDLIILITTLFTALKKRALFLPLTLLAVCIIFSLVSLMAPGNTMRGITVPNPDAHRLLFSLHKSFGCGIDLLRQWLPFMLFIGLLFFDILPENILWNEETDFIFIVPPWLTLVACLAIPSISMFIHFWAEGVYPPLRLVNLAYFYFVAGMLYFSLSLLSRIKKRYPAFRLSVYVKLPLYAILVVLLFFRTNNITVAYHDILSGTASAYNKERIDRHNAIINCKGDSCMVDSIQHIPASLFFFELPRDSNEIGNHNNWVNKAFCEYYNKIYIGVKGRSH